ncbi:unnamed protein product [Amoebophrya sp. A25]|nr:unnamed protein product [Amoebophrya sp. A25]|eukprot:GSA25T00005715001.1
MNAQTGVWHLRKVRIRFSHTGGSSRGVRFHFAHLMDEWKKRNPRVEIVMQHSQFEHPQMTAEWRSGECQTVCLRNMNAQQLDVMMDLFRNSESPNLFLKHGGPRVWTERRSIQGMWQPSYEGMAAALKWAHTRDKKTARLKYSAFSLKLSQQAWRGEGRWGDERQVRRGFDRDLLKAVFIEPFLPGTRATEQPGVSQAGIAGKHRWWRPQAMAPGADEATISADADASREERETSYAETDNGSEVEVDPETSCNEDSSDRRTGKSKRGIEATSNAVDASNGEHDDGFCDENDDATDDDATADEEDIEEGDGSEALGSARSGARLNGDIEAFMRAGDAEEEHAWTKSSRDAPDGIT